MKSWSSQLNFLLFFCFSALGALSLTFLKQIDLLNGWEVAGIFSIGLVGTYRWLWFGIRILRSRFYLHWVFPRWRRRADQIPLTDLPPVCLVVPTYREQPWITERVFQAIAREAKTLAHPITLLVNSSSDEENAGVVSVLRQEDPDLKSINLILMTQKDGKRQALADSLRELTQHHLPADSVIALMDGDSELAPGTLRACLPFFRLFPRLGALTTDELPVVQGSDLISEWFHLRFAQRHYQMCSDALSGKVMCLTGRFSLFRSEAALDPTFAQQLEADTLDDWLWGKFKFLSGDDKSSWFWLLQRRYTMLYVPDSLVYSIETISGSPWERAYQNMRRWYGNMLRSNGRAIALGPKVTGWLIWYNLIDQRLSIWTSLLTPGMLLMTMLQGHWLATGIIASWVVLSRPLMLILVFWGRTSTLKPIHLPILLLSQWGSAVIKVWTQMNLAQQKWTNRGNQSISAGGTGTQRLIKLGMARFLLFAQVFSFIFFLGYLSGSVNPTWDLAGLWLNHQVNMAQRSVHRVDAIAHQILPNDGVDDAAPLQALIEQLPLDTLVQIDLPLGELDFYQPVVIQRGDITLRGQGIGRTVVQFHTQTSGEDAILTVRPHPLELAEAVRTSGTAADTTAPYSHPSQPDHTIRNVQLMGFTLVQYSSGSTPLQEPVTGILLENVAESSLRHLQLTQGDRNSLILRQTQAVKVEYVSIEEELHDVLAESDRRNSESDRSFN